MTIDKLWHSGDERAWNQALERYWNFVKPAERNRRSECGRAASFANPDGHGCPPCSVLSFGATDMKAICLISAATIMAMHSVCGEQVNPAANTNGVTFREPFTLKLHVDKEHYFEQEFPKTPYVYQHDVYLFKGDAFGIDLQITNGVIRRIVHQADTNKAAVSFRFTQDVKDDGEAMMLLVIENRTKRKLFIDALMTVPAKERPQKTSILPVEPGLSGYESWPHPIVQLVLRNIRLTQEPNTKPAGPADGSRPVRSGTNGQPPATGSRR